jgi:hypothetical protein
MRRVRAVAGALALLVSAAATGAAPVAAPDNATHLGVASCASYTCHGQARPATAGSKAASAILRTEYVIWSTHDPHARAHAALASPRGQRIAQRLGLGDAREAAECLTCHTDEVPKARQGVTFRRDDGIGCEACHGGAQPWLATHDDSPAVTHADNVAAGMRALELPSVRATLCLACHVGDSNQRFASHAMMAAGHPRLGFELDTFTELWRTSGGREHYRVDDDYRQRKAVGTPLATWTTGLLRQADQTAGLVAQRYGGALPDFALFNCYSCHRAMGLKNWESKSTTTTPGALRLDDSSFKVLAAAVAGRPTMAAQLQQGVAAWQQSAASGAPAVKRSSRELQRRLQQLGAELQQRPLSAGEAKAALKALRTRAARGDFPDYASAEQAAMGIVVLLAVTGEQRDAALNELFRTLEDDDRYDPDRFRRALERLR